MPGLGTLINVLGIIAGGIGGLIFGRFITRSMQQSLMIVLGICCIFIAVQGALSKMLIIEPDGSIETTGHMMLIFSLTIGTVIGELIDVEEKFECLGEFLKDKTGNAGDTRFINAFVTSSLTVAIGAMAIMGSIQDGIMGDYSILAVKALLDMIVIMIMTSVMGRGCIFSAIPVGVLEGSMTLLARLIAPIFTEAALDNISILGSVLVLLVGVNIIKPRSIRVANMLPSIVLSVVWAYIPWVS